MLQKTFFASKGTKNLVEYPKPGRDFSTKSRKRSGERRSGAGNRTHAARGKKRPAASAGRQTDRERLYAGHARPGPATGIGDRKEGTGKRARERGRGKEGAARSMRKPARRSHQSGWRKRTPHGRSPAQEKAPHGKEPRTEGTPHGRNPAQGKAPHKQEKIPHGRMSRIEKKPRPRECFARKKSRAEGTRTGDHFAQFAQGKNPHGSGKYQR